MQRRVHIPQGTKSKVQRFYCGALDIAGDSVRASIHHLDGNRANPAFPNLIYLTLDAHNRLKRGMRAADLPLKLVAHSLYTHAAERYRDGHFTHAYGCLRLAFALSIHIIRQVDRDSDRELKEVSDCLYYLRRSLVKANPDHVYTHLVYILDRELPQIVGFPSRLPPLGSFRLLVELGSWLNECGHSIEGLTVIQAARNRFPAILGQLGAPAASRVLRQLSTALTNTSDFGKKSRSMLGLIAELSDKDMNSCLGIDCAKLYSLLARGHFRLARAVAMENYTKVQKQLDDFEGGTRAIDAIITMVLGFVALVLICECQFAKGPGARNRIERTRKWLTMQESHFGMKMQLHHVPGLQVAALSAARNVPTMAVFLQDRQYPVLPQSVRDSIMTVARRLAHS
jgi:hypothetical protein